MNTNFRYVAAPSSLLGVRQGLVERGNTRGPSQTPQDCHGKKRFDLKPRDLILLDVIMPEIDGYEVRRNSRKIGRWRS